MLARAWPDPKSSELFPTFWRTWLQLTKPRKTGNYVAEEQRLA